MRRLIPYPLLAAALFGMWLLLTQTFSPGQVLLGAIAALIATHAVAALGPERSEIGSLPSAVRLTGVVIADIIRSNIAVASIILTQRPRVSGFVQLPLELRDRHGLAVLALIITATPGTSWVDYDRQKGILMIHVLDLVDEDQWVRLIKGRYEARLLEVFGR